MTNTEIIVNLATIIADQRLEISELKTEVAHLHHELMAMRVEADTPQTDIPSRDELGDCNSCEYLGDLRCGMCTNGSGYRRADTPQTESTGSPIGDYRDGVGAWQTDCEDRYAIRTDSGEVVAYACPLGCEQTDCPWE